MSSEAIRPGKKRPAPRASEERLQQIRRQAERQGQVDGQGIQPPGAPFPLASGETGYYGLPLLKSPQWTWEVPAYFFVGGAAGAAAVIGAVAKWAEADAKLVREARWMAAAGGAVSAALLTSDLGRPSRFLNMLRVFKIQSPMSAGAWLLFAFSSAAVSAAFAEELGRRYGESVPVRVLGDAGSAFSGLLGLGLSSYTGVLIGATAIPVWAEHVAMLPIHFAASGMAAAASLLELCGNHTAQASRALNTLAVGGAIIESLEGLNVEMRRNRAARPLTSGATGWMTRAGGVLSGPLPLALRLMAGFRGRGGSGEKLRRAAAISAIAGSVLTRFAWLEAGRVSAQDPAVPLELPGETAPQLSPLRE